MNLGSLPQLNSLRENSSDEGNIERQTNINELSQPKFNSIATRTNSQKQKKFLMKMQKPKKKKKILNL